jgi:hypothetical protein
MGQKKYLTYDFEVVDMKKVAAYYCKTTKSKFVKVMNLDGFTKLYLVT